MTHITWRHSLAFGCVLTLCLGMVGRADAQSSSLLQATGQPRPLGLAQHSWFYVDVPPPKELKKFDVITVIVDEKSQVISEGNLERRNQGSSDSRLTNWLRLDGLDIKPAPQFSGDPAITGSFRNLYRAEADLETRAGMKFRIAATIVDVRPNGNLVLEAHYTVDNNDETWERSLSGIVRREDVLPNNTVLSEDIAELRITKREKGSVRDGYRRGWLLRIIDRYQPF